MYGGRRTKDLTLVNEDLSNIVILDNTPHAYQKFEGILLNLNLFVCFYCRGVK